MALFEELAGALETDAWPPYDHEDLVAAYVLHELAQQNPVTFGAALLLYAQNKALDLVREALAEAGREDPDEDDTEVEEALFIRAQILTRYLEQEQVAAVGSLAVPPQPPAWITQLAKACNNELWRAP